MSFPPFSLHSPESSEPQEGSFIRQQNVAPDGSLQELMPAVSLQMRCEKKGCTNEGGRDYKRKKMLGGWAGEPIFLCDHHGAGREPA